MDIERVNIFLLIPLCLHFAASAFYGNEEGTASLKTSELAGLGQALILFFFL